ncbi:SUMF1/EgtB/PvdO family nonheme iron enzyme [Thiolinea disciformis]|uniref:SUMF1/EgtB/PvdO family nonheme iron enzyme n=1 Tax=Thiolinea disciformis TaxID=125614 RepID=UPI00036E95ED|nr:SUMF1/EgtB/PvdO family nonheme iron enzyme [Thiolinea disciformis]
MQKWWLVCWVVFPSLALADELAKPAEPVMGWGAWFWANIQSIEALGSLLTAVVPTFFVALLAVWYFFFKKKPEQTSLSVVQLPVINPSQLEQYYYEHLSQACQRYDLGSFRDSQSNAEKARIQVSLADVYVDLLAYEIQPDNTDKSDGLAHQSLRESKLLLAHLQEQGLKRMVVRGDVGSGKSSFINYLCFSLIESHHGKELTPTLPPQWQRRPVVRILLREIGSKIFESSDLSQQLMHFVRQQVEVHVRQVIAVDEHNLKLMWESFRTDFERSGVLILDGLDEVSNSHEQAEQRSRRQLLLEAIQALARHKTYENMAIIVTSRNHAYGGDDALLGFRLFQLEPLSVQQRYEYFIQHWYQRVANTPEEQASYESDARQLLNNIAKRPSLRPLTETPLLLTLILVLDKAKIGLPESRAELYQHAVMLLLERWNKQLLPYEDSLSVEERQALEILKLDPSILLEAMKALAEHTYRTAQLQTQEKPQDTIVFSVDAVESALKAQLQQYSGLGFAHQDSCQNFLRFRSQILVAVGEDLSFVHKSFHEYLTAAYVMERSMSRERILREMISSEEQRDWWREVFLFAMNIEKAEFMLWQMKQQVLSRPLSGLDAEAVDNHLGMMSLFSEAALENSLEKVVSRDAKRNPELSAAYHDLQNYLQEWWDNTRLSIPQKARLGRIWGHCGDTREGLTFQRDAYVIRYATQTKRSFPLPDFKWCEIPTGEFLMGTQGEDGWGDEKPAQNMVFDQPFYMTASPITNAQYQAFVDAGGYEDESLWRALPQAAQDWWRGDQSGDLALIANLKNKDLRDAYQSQLLRDKQRRQLYFWQSSHWNIANHPVVGVSWFEALAYVEWLNRHQQQILPAALYAKVGTIRLPREDEWEYAARSSANLIYACGELAPNKANYRDSELERTSVAGLFAANPLDLWDMTGNVWEWTSSRWGNDIDDCAYPYGEDYQQTQVKQNDLNTLDFKIVRGCSWYGNTEDVRCAVRNRNHPNNRNYFVGFRVLLNSP